MRCRRCYWLLLPLLVLILLTPGAAAQEDPARRILAAMTPAERVGQLFIVSYVGADVSPESDMGKLIREYDVGGVVLLSANQNFVNDADAPQQVLDTTQQLQAMALESGALPLLISIDHEGDGWPYTRLTGGATPLPSPMAVGATWNPDLARQVGEITGRELAAVGINLLLGPTVDVLNDPRATSKGDLGTRVFGGDPYWVGEMGRAYIRGVHEGSGGRVGVVAKHFPGHGGSDRLPDDEVATVDKSLQELRRIELAPFFAVTRYEGADDPAVAEALMSSHIRYRGFQGNIRQFTAPLSFDPAGLRTILAEEEFARWRENGVIVSDSLGVPAVKKYFDPTGTTFPHRQVARDALMAGNDLLILAQFGLGDSWPLQLRNMEDTLLYFRQQYEEDRLFAERVDEAALRVIRLKLKLYPGFAEGDGELPPLPEVTFGAGAEVTQAVAEQAATLLHPRTPSELEERLPHPPLRGEPIVIFTDARRVRDCFDCPYYQLIPTDALQQAILQRYGPEGTDQITEAQIISFSFDDLKLFLGAPGTIESSQYPVAAQERADAVANLVERAQWILLVMQDINLLPSPGGQSPRWPESDAGRLLLDAATGSLFNKKVVGFFFNVPYQLDTTEISKLSAAYALYSKQPAFLDVAARVLFRDIIPRGAAPVSVEAVNYDLPTRLEPDPEQSIDLRVLPASPLVAPVEVEIESGVILDRNGNPVPDGTLIDLVGRWEDGMLPEHRLSTSTMNGIARATLRLERGGTLALHVTQAENSPPLLLEILEPTPTATATSEATATPDATAVPPETPFAEESRELAVASAVGTPRTGPPREAPERAPSTVAPADSLSISDFLLGMLGTFGMAGVVWRFTSGSSLERRVRASLFAVIGGMGGYLLWGVFGAASGSLLSLAVVLGGSLFGLGLGRTVPE